MIRTQIELTDEQMNLLKMLAIKEDLSIAELIRRSIDRYLQINKQLNLAERKQRAFAINGKYASGSNDLSITHDQTLANIYAEVSE